MVRRVNATFLSLVFAVSGCGARTALLLDPARDAGTDASDDAQPDVFGPYPCNYGYTGELAPVVPGAGESHSPQLAWGRDRLAVAFRADEEWGMPYLGACTTRREEGLWCDTFERPGNVAWWQGDLAWNGSGFGLCWGGEPEWNPGIEGILFRGLSPLGEPVTDAAAVADEVAGDCHRLVRAGDGYLAAWVDDHGFPPVFVQVVRLDREGRLVASVIPDLDPLPALPPRIDLEADGGVAALAWGAPEGIRIRALDGLDGAGAVIRVGGVEMIALGLRESIAGVLWAQREGRATTLSLALVDLTRGHVGPAVEVASFEGSAIGIDVIGVYEGFMLAWVETGTASGLDRITALPVRVHDGLEIEPRSEIVLHEGAVEGWAGTVGPALATDGTDVYLAVVVYDPDIGMSQVHLQRLACHR